eukprot:8758941-Alexandrium_andersonii.AAC.1
MASYASPAMLPPCRSRRSRQSWARRSSTAMPHSVRARSHASALRSAPSAPRSREGGPHRRPARHT